MERIDISREFNIIAGSNEVLGNPKGTVAYGYARVSTGAQAEEGTSGLPRQLEAIHKTAIRDNLYVPLVLLFVDDGYSGFEYEDRPAFTRLRHELRSAKQADHLVVEEIDRLSRNAEWHQGLLLDEFARRKVTVHFLQQPTSELERYIKGYIAQEAMRKEKERMRLGKIYKAMDGRVTASRAAYGYELSGSKDTHYVINDEEAAVIRTVYNFLTMERKSLYQIADILNAWHVPGRRGGS
jgi:DNA invertase Pin-like site-specific DNA recombinase